MPRNVNFIWNWVIAKCFHFIFYSIEWISIVLTVPFPIITTSAGLSSPNCELFFKEHFSEVFSLNPLPGSLPHIIVIKIMQHNYKHIVEAQMPAWTTQLLLHAYWNFSSRKKKCWSDYWGTSMKTDEGGREKVSASRRPSRVLVWEAELDWVFLGGSQEACSKLLDIEKKCIEHLPYARCFIHIAWFLHESKFMKFAFHLFTFFVYHFIDEITEYLRS